MAAERCPVAGIAEHYDVRQHLVRRFRNIVVTAVVRDERLVVAVAHTSRQPGYWRDRVR
jgi:hypothetical protein